MLEWFLHKTKQGDYIINACDSSKDKEWTGWLRQWMIYFSKNDKPMCVVKNCSNIANTGAHVRLLRGNHELRTIYIVPMCSSCNNKHGKHLSAPPRMAVRSRVELMESNLANLCRYRCRNFCRYKVRRARWWFVFWRKITVLGKK